MIRSTGPLASSRCAPTMRPAMKVAPTMTTTRMVVRRVAIFEEYSVASTALLRGGKDERAGQYGLGQRASEGPLGSHRGSGCRYRGLRPGSCAGRRGLELDDAAVRYARARRDSQGKARGTARQLRDRQQHDGDPVRRQQQLVCRVGVLAVEALWPSGCPDYGRRPQEVARRRQGR